MEIIETSKSKPCLLYNGYQYRQDRLIKSSIMSWRCVNEKKEKCKGRLATENGEVIREAIHTCKPDIAKCDVRKQLSSARKRCREEEKPVSEIYKEEFNQLFNGGFDLVTDVPLYSSVKSVLCRARQRTKGNTKEPITANDIILSESDESLQLPNGENFLLADATSEKRIIVFSTTKSRELLSEENLYLMDGTFKCSPKQFYQLFTIHVDFRSTAEETNVYPVAFALLPDKKQTTYRKLFEIIHNALPEWNPTRVVLDFEESVILAIKHVFPSVKVTGCNFHFQQCLWKKIQAFGLVQQYRENEEIRLHLRMCSSLAFLKQEDVDEGWISIQESTPEDENLRKFYDYFVSQWLDNNVITVDMWNCFNKKHRTNNAVEGWHNRFNRSVWKPHPRFQELIKALKEEAEYADFLIKRKEMNLEGKRRKMRYIKIDNRLQKCQEEYEKTGNIRKLLETVAHVQKFE